MQLDVIQIDYRNAAQAEHLKTLLDIYAQDEMGGGQPIEPTTLAQLPARLAEMPTAFSLIVYVDGTPAALANCLFGFSTFAARKLVNIHDVVVHPDFRGRGLTAQLFAKIEQLARQHDCCKLTLEVVDQNTVAMNAYRKLGFTAYELDESKGIAQFWQKKVP